jgi:hypothetical protein
VQDHPAARQVHAPAWSPVTPAERVRYSSPLEREIEEPDEPGRARCSLIPPSWSGFLFACAIYLILQQLRADPLRLRHHVQRGQPAAPQHVGQPRGQNGADDGHAGGTLVDPLPQALILTAIVIGFGVTAYLVMLLYRLFLDHKTTNAVTLYEDQAPEADDE